MTICVPPASLPHLTIPRDYIYAALVLSSKSSSMPSTCNGCLQTLIFSWSLTCTYYILVISILLVYLFLVFRSWRPSKAKFRVSAALGSALDFIRHLGNAMSSNQLSTWCTAETEYFLGKKKNEWREGLLNGEWGWDSWAKPRTFFVISPLRFLFLLRLTTSFRELPCPHFSWPSALGISKLWVF